LKPTCITWRDAEEGLNLFDLVIMPNEAYQLPRFKAIQPQLAINILHSYM